MKVFIILFFTILSSVSVWGSEVRPDCGTKFDVEFSQYNLENITHEKSQQRRQVIRRVAELQHKAQRSRSELSDYRVSILSGEIHVSASEASAQIDGYNAELAAICFQIVELEAN